MSKKLVLLPITAALTFSLVGCSQDEATNGNQQISQPFGYYSNENHNGGGNARIYNENDGPLVEIMDHSLGEEGQRSRENRRQHLMQKDEAGNPANPTVPRAKQDKNFFERDNRYSHADANYHGHLDDQTRKARSSYYTAYEGDLAEKIGDVTAKVPNVEDVRSVVYGSNVLIAVDLTNYDRDVETKADITKAVQPYLRGRSVQVVTDEGTFSRIRNIDNDLRDGGPRETIDADIKGMFRTLKSRIQGKE